MPYELIVRAGAESDIAEAMDWYDAQCPDLGEDFLAEARKGFNRIALMPEIYATVFRNVRCFKIARFNYVVYYRVTKQIVEVLAVVHGSRDASAWKSRL
jgi:plasmid stabilization system protein ParE